MKKGFYLLLLSVVLFACSQEKKAALDENYNSKEWKAYLEKVYTDSSDKKNLTLLTNLIDANLGGKIEQTSAFNIKNRLDSASDRLTYSDILNKWAIPYDKWTKEYATFKETINQNIEIQFITTGGGNGTEAYYDLKLTNKGAKDIISVVFKLKVENSNTGEILLNGMDIAYDQKISKNGKIKTSFGEPGVENIVNLDKAILKTNVSISKLSFSDGTSIEAPKEPTIN